MNKKITFVVALVASFFLSISIKEWLWTKPAWYEYLSGLQSKNMEGLVVLSIWLLLTVGLYITLSLAGALRKELRHRG